MRYFLKLTPMPIGATFYFLSQTHAKNVAPMGRCRLVKKNIQ